MLALFTILIDIILPVFIIMMIGYFIQKKFQLDLQTLSKINIYFVVPGFIFVKLYSTDFALGLLGKTLLFFILYVFLLFVVAFLVGKVLKLGKAKQTTFSNSLVFFNSGNYGLPVNDLVFKSDPFAMSIQVIVLTLQNMFLFSYGIFALQSVKIGKLKAMLAYFRMPVLYALLAGLGLNALNIGIPDFIWVPANYIADSMIAIALITLGAQVAQFKFQLGNLSVYVSMCVRLIIGPMMALGIIYLMGVEGTTAQALFIASAMPTSLNSAVIAQEYKSHPDFAAQIVLFSTIFSSITVTLVIYFAQLLF